MKILLLSIYDYPHVGGLSTHLTTLKSGLESRGHEVRVLSFSDVPKWKRDLIARGPSLVMNKIRKGAGYVWTLRRRAEFMEELLKDDQFKDVDLVNAEDVMSTRAATKAGFPVVTTVHGYMTFEGISKGSVAEDSKYANKIKQFEFDGYRVSREVVTVDTRIKEYIKKEADVDGHMIKNFIDVESFKPDTDRRAEFREEFGLPQEDKIFFIPRRLTKKNGVIYPILSFPPVVEKFPNARLVFAGTGEMMEEMKQKAKELGIADRVTMLGAVEHKDMIRYYAASDIVLVPSIYSAGVEEATSISALEAMGSGIPLIACAVGGLKEIVDHEKDGLLVAERNVEELSDAMIRLLESPDYGAQLAEGARQKIIDEYSHFAAAEKYEKIYMKALEK